jgi:hypothetical protein
MTPTATSSASTLSWETRQFRNHEHHPLVDFVLLAEFDIDTGSTLRHQFPHPVPDCKADWFAEHMLPEGAHNREFDYTYIFLNRTCKHIDDDIWVRPTTSTEVHETKNSLTPATDSTATEGDTSNSWSPAPDGGGDHINGDEVDAKYFLYGLNLVKTRYDATVRRGAIVKAMCIFSRYHFVEAFKTPLELALDSYFDNPDISELSGLFQSLNSIDISRLPRPDYLECLLMRRGVKYLPLYKSPTSEHHPRTWKRALCMQFKEKALSLSVPCHYTPDEIGDINISSLLKIFGEASMKIFHAILTKQRVLFVGYNHSTSDIAQMVLSAVAMVAPPLTGLIRRTFPYANLADLGFLEVKGYVAGVTNPMFQQREKWWDLLCVLDLPNNTGTVIEAGEEERSRGDTSISQRVNGIANNSNLMSGNTASGGIAQAAEELLHITQDQKFYQTVWSGVQARIGEEWVRQQFLDYTTSIFMNTLDKGLFLNSAKLGERIKRTLDANIPRMAQLDACTEFQQMPSNLWAWTQSVDNKSLSAGEIESNGLILKTYIRKLKYETGLDSKQETEVFFDFLEKHLVSESSLQALLVMLPESQGGIMTIAAGLFSSLPTVRLSTVQILHRMNEFASTRPALKSLDTFMRNAMERQTKKWKDGSLLQEVEDDTANRIELWKASL